MHTRMLELQEFYRSLPKFLAVPRIFRIGPCANRCGVCRYCYEAKSSLWKAMTAIDAHVWGLFDKELDGVIFMLPFANNGERFVELHGAIWTGQLWRYTSMIKQVLDAYRGIKVRAPVPDYARVLEHYLEWKLGFYPKRIVKQAVSWNGSFHNVTVMERLNGTTSNRTRHLSGRSAVRSTWSELCKRGKHASGRAEESANDAADSAILTADTAAF